MTLALGMGANSAIFHAVPEVVPVYTVSCVGGGPTLATNLALDDNLIEEARRIGHHTTKKEAVTAALKEYVQRRRQQRILDLAGQIEYEPNYNHKILRRRGSKS